MRRLFLLAELPISFFETYLLVRVILSSLSLLLEA